MTIAITLDHPEVTKLWGGMSGGVPGAGDASHAVRCGTIAADNSYPTGGESLLPADLGLTSIDYITFNGQAGYRFEYDYAANKLKYLYGDNNNAADGPLIEVPNTTDLSAVLTAVKFRAVGRITIPHELP